MSVPRVTSHRIYCHGFGEQLKTTHTTGSPAHLEKYLCNQLRVLGGGFSLSKACGCHPPLRNTQLVLAQSVIMCPSNGDMASCQCLCVPKELCYLSPTGPHSAGAHTSYQAAKDHCKVSLKELYKNNQSQAIFQCKNAIICKNIFCLYDALLFHVIYSLFCLLTYVKN